MCWMAAVLLVPMIVILAGTGVRIKGVGVLLGFLTGDALAILLLAIVHRTVPGANRPPWVDRYGLTLLVTIVLAGSAIVGYVVS